MGISVTSWYIDQLYAAASEPKRVMTLSGSDYTDRVVKWGSIKRQAQKFNIRDYTIKLANHDGEFNQFYATAHTLITSATLQIGFTHPTSGDELVTVFSGGLKNVRYSRETIELRLQNKFWKLGELTVGDTENPVTISGLVPTDAMWALLTSYGQLDNTASTGNVDIDYTSFLALAGVYSGDNLTITVRYDGDKVTKALESIMRYTDSAIYDKGDGKIYFDRFAEMSGNDTAYSDLHYTDIIIDVSDAKMINKATVAGLYDVNSKYWQMNVTDESSISVNTFGTHAEILEDDSVWFTTSADALGMAQRMTLLYDSPPADFNITLPLMGIQGDLAETVRLQNSFMSISSESAFRILEQEINLDTGQVKLGVSNAVALEPFYLDINYLDEFSAWYPTSGGDPRLL